MLRRDGDRPAFPCKDNIGNQYYGITLRDYFAVQAISGLVPDTLEGISGVMEIAQREDEPPSETLASMAYEIADAMLEERKND